VQNTFSDEVIANGGYKEVKGPPKTVEAEEAPKDQEPSADKVVTSTVHGEDIEDTEDLEGQDDEGESEVELLQPDVKPVLTLFDEVRIPFDSI
jgi:hypothetical protein